MPTSILIGFEYKDDVLPGAIIDLYHCYKWCESFNCEIKVLTDITEVDNKLLHQAINNNLAKKDILKFYDKIDPIIINNNLVDEIIKILSNGINDNKLIVYYSGHGVLNDNLVMPSKNLISMNKIKNIILENIDLSVEIFIVLDCCNPNGMRLPFKLENNLFKLSTKEFDSIDFVEHRILLITSASNYQKSVATEVGSLFSRYLFQILSNMNDKYDKIEIPLQINRNLQRLTSNLSCEIKKMSTGYQQNISIYSSYIIDPVLWMWLGSDKNHDIITDYTLTKILVIKNKL